MNNETFFSLMPTEVIGEDEVVSRIEEEQNIMEAGKRFASQLSINRYLSTPLVEFTLEERLQLFTTLHQQNFVYDENGLYFGNVDMTTFASILKEQLNIQDITKLDNFYLEHLLQGRDITEETFGVFEENLSLREILGQFVFTTWGMSMGDTPNLMLMLVVKKALLGSYLAKRNIERLQSGYRDIYSVSVLM